ncbi:MAG TPA: response regulator transcription factor [Nocardioidaceae bacterium]|nr:response regulator transcription factor [Nocardioidaceae bacterium]
MTDELRLALVDDDALVRAGLTAMLDGAEGIRIVAQAGDGREVPDLISAHSPDVVLMDLKMPGVDGVTATRRLREQANPPAVIVLTTYDEEALVIQAVQAGAVGYLLKHTPPAQLIDAIKLAYDGTSSVSPEAATHLVSAVVDQRERTRRGAHARTLLERLTPRERDVAQAVAAGNSNAAIGTALALSPATVKSHVTVIMTKLEVDNRVQLALVVQAAT